MSTDQVLLQIQDNPALKWPGKLRSSPTRRSKDLYCRFHRDHGHNTKDCYVLKEQIEALIRQVKLKKFVHRDNQEARPPRQEENKNRLEDRPRDIIGEIRTIVGGLASGGASRSSRKAYARQAHNVLVTQRPRKNVKLDNQVVTFSEDDARGIHQPHDDALIITMTIAGFITRRVLIDNGSSTDIIYLPAYQQMKIDKERLRPIDIPLVGFTGEQSQSIRGGLPHDRSWHIPETSNDVRRIPGSRLPVNLQRHHWASNSQQTKASDLNISPSRPFPYGTWHNRTQEGSGSNKRMLFHFFWARDETPNNGDRRGAETCQTY
jgi:hypothetical protein